MSATFREHETQPKSDSPRLTATDVKSSAAKMGFIACGITTLDLIPHAEHLDQWLKSGYGGNMRYIHRQAKKRKNPQLADPKASRAVVVLDNYYYDETNDQPSQDPRVRLARYARGQDYHRDTFERVQALANI
jgi:epoxyqueuosine reductase